MPPIGPGRGRVAALPGAAGLQDHERVSSVSDDRPGSPVPAALVALRRWQDAGGIWRVVGHRNGTVTVALCRCDGGEEVERISSSHPQVLASLAGRTGSEDDVDSPF